MTSSHRGDVVTWRWRRRNAGEVRLQRGAHRELAEQGALSGARRIPAVTPPREARPAAWRHRSDGTSTRGEHGDWFRRAGTSSTGATDWTVDVQLRYDGEWRRRMDTLRRYGDRQTTFRRQRSAECLLYVHLISSTSHKLMRFLDVHFVVVLVSSFSLSDKQLKRLTTLFTISPMLLIVRHQFLPPTRSAQYIQVCCNCTKNYS